MGEGAGAFALGPLPQNLFSLPLPLPPPPAGAGGGVGEVDAPGGQFLADLVGGGPIPALSGPLPGLRAGPRSPRPRPPPAGGRFITPRTSSSSWKRLRMAAAAAWPSLPRSMSVLNSPTRANRADRTREMLRSSSRAVTNSFFSWKRRSSMAGVRGPRRSPGRGAPGSGPAGPGPRPRP